MTLRADLYWSFRSPYSYLAIGRYRAMAGDHDLIDEALWRMKQAGLTARSTQ